MLMEGGLREERGDMAGAWDCYRAVLRMTVHVRRRERLGDRARVNLHLPSLRKHLATWAADPRTTIHQVRRALEEVVECRPMPDWDAFTLKIEYLDLMRFLDRRVVPPTEQIEEEWTYRLGEMQLPVDLSLDLYQVKRGLAREPERSRRVIRLLFANWLAHVEHPGQRKPAARARFHIAKQTNGVLLYHVSPDAPADARALSPQEVASWLVTTNDAKLALRCVCTWRGLPFAGRNSAVIESCSYSWLERSIAASAAHCRLPTKPWSGPISRACPTTARPTWPMR